MGSVSRRTIRFLFPTWEIGLGGGGYATKILLWGPRKATIVHAFEGLGMLTVVVVVIHIVIISKCNKSEFPLLISLRKQCRHRRHLRGSIHTHTHGGTRNLHGERRRVITTTTTTTTNARCLGKKCAVDPPPFVRPSAGSFPRRNLFDDVVDLVLVVIGKRGDFGRDVREFVVGLSKHLAKHQRQNGSAGS